MVTIPLIFSISADGFIRLNENQLMNHPLQHLISIVESTQIEDSQILYYGFTEWATSLTPALSTGWDWEFIEYNGITSIKELDCLEAILCLLMYLVQILDLKLLKH